MVSKTRKRGGKSGKIQRYIDFTNLQRFGSGGYGTVVLLPSSKEVVKLLYDTDSCKKLKHEAHIQQKAYNLFKKYLPEVGIPKLTMYNNTIIKYQGLNYLCGIGMEYLEPPLDFDETVHMLLGYDDQDDIDSSWGKTQSQPVSSTNPTRGFFASPETLEIIWKQEGSTMTLEKLATLMGKANKLLLTNNILPIDVEYIWANNKPYIIDFGLCEEASIDPFVFLEKKGYYGLADDIYIPNKHHILYNAFMEGFSAI
jgi:hypothetical protein